MKKFDVLIIGTGMGGLVCGNVLAKQGYTVCMVEKNKQLGGCLQIYVRNRVIFDSGVHYIGGLDEGQNLYQIFKWLGLMNELKLEKMDPDFDRIILDEDQKEYKYMQGYDAFEKEMIHAFPAEEKAIRTYTKTIREICDRFPLYRLQSQADGGKQEVMGISAKKFIESVTNNKKLQAVLAGNNMLYAGSGEATPFYIHALTVNSYIESAWRCLDGGSQISKILARNISKTGGQIVKNREVKKLHVEEGVVKSAELNDGTLIQADYFVSNTTPANTYRMTDTHLIRSVTRQRIEAMPTTVSAFILNIVFKKDRFPYLKHNYYYQKTGSVWAMDTYSENEWPLGYAIYCSPAVGKEFARGMTIFAYMRYDEVRPWEDSFNTVSSKQNRGTEYEQFKDKKTEQLLNRVEEKFPDLRKSILHTYTSTPLSFRDYIGNEDGNLYGTAKDYRNPMGTLISPKTRIPNLFLTGQYLNLHGILGTAISGLITSIALTGKDDFIEKIRNA
ncbi:MAG TPA: NAD(P)/FAD-dependent oxidoreductase [Puia sp.]|nr:NAD(P)/FAD-dependent oxidoreductase [Puia sp.]